MFSTQSGGEPSSLQEAFSPSYPEPLLHEGEEEPTCGGPAGPLKKSISDSWDKEAGEKLHMVSPASDKGSVPCTEGGMQDKRNSSGKAENSPSCWCEVLWHLIYEVFVPPGLSWETEAATLIVKSFCTEQCCLLLSRS